MDQNQPPAQQPPSQPVNPPVQPQQMPPQTQKTNNKTIWIVVGLVACLPLLAITGILAAMVLTGLHGAREKSKDAQIQSSVNTLKTTAEMYYDKNGTYQGWVADPQYSNSIEQVGSKAIVQGLSDKTYVIYAKLLSSNQLFCVDGSDFSGEVTAIVPTQTSCQ